MTVTDPTKLVGRHIVNRGFRVKHLITKIRGGKVFLNNTNKYLLLIDIINSSVWSIGEEDGR